MHSLKYAACIAIALLLIPACASDGDGTGNAGPPPAPKSLYDRLGGEKVITVVVDDFVQRVMANEAVNFTRKGTPAAWEPTPVNVARLKAGLVAFITEVSGGPVKYKGKDMKAAHAGMAITDKEFFTAARDLENALLEHGVPAVETAELMQLVATTRGDIVTK